jgi:hypothetical protein
MKLILNVCAAFAIALAVSGVVAQTNPSPRSVKYSDARPILDAMDRVIGNSALVKPGTVRQRNLQVDEIKSKAKRVFGVDVFDRKWGECVKAANLFQDVAIAHTGLILASSTTTPVELGGFMQLSYEFGNSYRMCKTEVEALDPPPPQECLRVLDLSKPNAPLPPLPAHCPKPKL